MAGASNRTRLRLAAALAVAAACLATLAAAPAAQANSRMVSILQDDNILVYGSSAQRELGLRLAKGLGVDVVRVTVHWQALSPGRRRPRGATTSPRAYKRWHWDPYDELVRDAARHGIGVYLNPTGWGPRWAHERTGSPLKRTWKPKAREFERFVVAVGRRYSGRYRDETDGAVLPRVNWWSIWNEPNQPGWLAPQSARVGGRLVPRSPAMYRNLLVAGLRGLARAGHRRDRVLIGETAPLGGRGGPARRPLRPALFLRELFCLDRGLQPFRGAAAAARGCGSVRKLALLKRFPRLGYAHHPYTRKGAPARRDRHSDAITTANLGALPRLLDAIARRTGLIRARRRVYLTEYGFETSPPDPYKGVSLQRQAAYINQGDFLAYRQPRVYSTAQFQLFDVPPRTEAPTGSSRYWATYQSGLVNSSGWKPAAFAYMMPVHVRRRGGRYRLWGQIRFRPNGERQLVALQYRPPGSANWLAAGRFVRVRNRMGFYQAARRAPFGSAWRAVWVPPSGGRNYLTSREAG